jgi:hypothetical protein
MNIRKGMRIEAQPQIEIWWPDGNGNTKKIELDHTPTDEGDDEVEIDITEDEPDEKPN